MEVVCAFSSAIRLAWCMQWLHRSVGTWRSRLRCRGRHVRGFCVTGLPFCAGLLCLHLPVTFKAQGFKSRGGGTFVASALLGLPFCAGLQQLLLFLFRLMDSGEEEQELAGADAHSQVQPRKRLTIARLQSQLEAGLAQLRLEQKGLAGSITAAVLEALRGQAQQPIQGPGPEAEQAEQAHAQQHQQQAAQRQPQTAQSTNFRPDVAFGQLGAGDFDAGLQDQFQPDVRAAFGETFANLLAEGYANGARQTGGEARRVGDRGGGPAVRADDDSLARNPTWRPNFVIAKAQLRRGNSLCATFLPALLERHGSVQNFLEDSILRDQWNERDKHEASTLALVLDAFIRASVDLRGEYCEIVYRRFVGIVYHAKDGSWTIADELLRPVQKVLRLVDDDVTDSALLLAATRAKIEAQHAASKKRSGKAGGSKAEEQQ